MSATYTAVTLDGQEHAGVDLETLKQWYCARRLRADSFVLSSELGQWKLLKNLFDTSQWQAEQRAAGGSWMNDAAHETVPTSQTYYQPSAETSYPTPSQENGANERNLGVRTAAIFLFVNAALNLISLAYIGVQHTSADHSSSPSWGLSIIFDVIVGAKLLRSDNVKRWRRYALGRACLGGLIFGTLFITMGRTDAARAIGLMQFVFAASFVLLLMGNSPSRARVAAGALAFVISLSGILGIYFVGDMTGEVTEKQEILKYALPTRSFNDALSGASVELPNGWVMLPPINPITNIPEAHMIAAHPESGSFAALEIVRTVEGSELNEVLSRVVADLQKRDPTTVESERVNIQFGRLDGRKVILEWEYKGAKVKGALTVARNGHYYFLLHEWCMAESFAKSRVQFAALESGASAGEPTPNQFSETHGQTY